MTKILPIGDDDADVVESSNNNADPPLPTSTSTQQPSIFDGKATTSMDDLEKQRTDLKQSLVEARSHAEKLEVERKGAVNHIEKLEVELNLIEVEMGLKEPKQLPDKEQNQRLIEDAPTSLVQSRPFGPAQTVGQGPPRQKAERRKAQFPDGGATLSRTAPAARVLDTLSAGGSTDEATRNWLFDLNVDSQSRVLFASLLDTQQIYTKPELDAYANGKILAGIFKFSGLMSPTNMDSKLTSVDLCESFYNSKKGDCYGRVFSVVPGSPSEVLAFYVDSTSRFKSSDTKSAAFREVLAKPNEHCELIRRVKPIKGVKGLSGREWVENKFWKKQANGDLVMVNFPGDVDLSEHHDPSLVRAISAIFATFTQEGDSSTRVQFYYHFNLNGHVPAIFTHHAAPLTFKSIAIEAVQYFQNVRKQEAGLSEVDGTNMGDLLMLRVNAAMAKSGWKNKLGSADLEIEAFIVENDVARHFAEQHPWFKIFLMTIVRNKIRPRNKVKTKLARLSNEEAKKIAASLPIAVLTNLDSAAAIDEWISNSPALLELEELVWFRPMMNSMALRLLKDGNLGLKARISFGAFMSYFDMGSDSYMIFRFARNGNLFYAYATLGSICVNLVIQLLLVFIVNHKRGRKVVFRESLIVLTFLKPAVDAFRIATDAETDDLGTMTPLHESTSSRGVEMLFESIPSAVMLVLSIINTFVTGAPMEIAPIISLVISILTIGYTSALSSYDIDTSMKNRKKNPELYGYVANTARSLILVQMVLFSAAQAFSKVLATALLWKTDPSWLMGYFAIDMSVFFGWKLATGDFYYVTPISGIAQILISIILRLGTKLGTDFTCLIMSRSPTENGGAYWLFNLVMSHASCFASVFIFVNNYEVGSSEVDSGSTELSVPNVDFNNLYIVATLSFAVWLFNFVWFMFTIDRNYVKTFFSTMTAPQQTVHLYRAAKTDEQKALIFKRTVKLWRPLVGDVRIWVNENLKKWEIEKPDFFTPRFIEKIPDEVLSQQDIERLIKQGKRRKSSLMNDVRLAGR
jgi:hypothetical protein